MRKVKAYCCSKDAEYHMGEDYHGVTIYFSEKALRDHCKCVSEESNWGCKVVKISVILPDED